jgi:DNA topoisomerase-1
MRAVRRNETRKQTPVSPDPVASARAARLRYVNDADLTLRRVAAGKGFRYVDAAGKAVRDGDTVRFHFRGKSGIEHAVDVSDRRLARVVKRCQDVPGQELFQYVDADGARHKVGFADVNDYLRQVTGQEFTAKDFRTWAGTVLATQALREFEAFDSQTQARRNVMRAIEAVAKRLGNTKAICRKCYVHPAVIDAYLDGSLVRALRRRVGKELRRSLATLPPEEAAVLAFLQERLRQM